MKAPWLILFLVVIADNCIAQDIPRAITEQIELLIDEESEEIDIANLYDRLYHYYDHPLDINSASVEELTDTQLFTDIQINDLQQHLTQLGPLLHIAELQAIPSFSTEDVRLISHFASVENSQTDASDLLDMIKNSRHELLIKGGQILETKKGYIENADGETKYLGDPYALQMRWRTTYGNKLRIGLIAEKDAGEPLFAEGQTIDYLSGHIQLYDYSRMIKNIIVGDYTVSMGQGLISHNSFIRGKSALVTRTKKGGRTLRPYNSVLENNLNRGAAATFRIRDNIDLTFFYSHLKLDGNEITDGIDEENIEGTFSSLQRSGLHRTSSELEDKDAITNTSSGFSAKYKSRNTQVALNGISHRFAGNITRSDRLYNKYAFSGNTLSNLSIDFSHRVKNITLFSETSYSSTGGMANLTGVLIGLDKSLSASLLYRYYDKKYNALLPNAFGESASVQNETGIYMGIQYDISKKWRLRVYADHWRHPWVKYRISRPSSGKEYLIRLDYYKRKRINIYTQYLYENKEADYTDPFTKIVLTGNQIRHRIRLHCNNKVSNTIELRTRIEYSHFANSITQENGLILYQDLMYRPKFSPLSLTSRFMVFDTDGYDSRIYTYENALLYEFLIPAYFHQGIRYYLNLNYRLNKSLTAEIRITQTKYAKADQIKDPLTNRYRIAIGSGNEQIIGNSRTELKVQLRYRL